MTRISRLPAIDANPPIGSTTVPSSSSKCAETTVNPSNPRICVNVRARRPMMDAPVDVLSNETVPSRSCEVHGAAHLLSDGPHAGRGERRGREGRRSPPRAAK